MKKTMMSIMMAAFLMFAFSINSYSQKKVTKQVTSTAVDKSRGSNPNIKGGAPTADVAAAKSRGTCSVNFDSYSPLYIEVYVDGYYKGTVSPYGSMKVYVGEGYTTIYCVSSGGSREWNAAGDCREAYTYTLR